MQEQKGVKVLIVGTASVGKTSLIVRFASDQFTNITQSTLGATYFEKLFTYQQQKSMLFQLWDTAGQQRYKSLVKIYYRDAKIAIVMYDVTNTDSFQLMKDWINQLKQQTREDVMLVIVGNKIDLLGNSSNNTNKGEDVNYQTAKQFAQKSDAAIFKLVSAKSNIGVIELFTQIAKKYEEKKKNEIKIDTTFKNKKIQKMNEKKNKTRCC